MTSLAATFKLEPAALVAMLAKEYGLNAGDQSALVLNSHRKRRDIIAQRLRLYRDCGRKDFEAVIDTIFETLTVQEQRKKLIGVATEQNVWARIANEVASLYDQPALREFDDAATTERYRARALEVELDEVMQEAQRLTFVCNETLLWLVEAFEGEPPDLHILTPDAFDAIPHPANCLRAVGYVIDTAPPFVTDGVDVTKVKHYEIWDDEVTYHLDLHGRLIGAPIPHEPGIPGVLFHRRKPVDCILDSRAGSDITSAHLGVGLLAIMAMRLAKSQGERQPVLSGNLANVAAGQSADGEKPLLLPPEVIASMLDTKTSPEHYLLLKADKLDSIEQTYGIPPKQSGPADSGAAFQARRMKLTELRAEQRRRAPIHERLVAKLLGFDPKGLDVDHQEQAVPVDAVQELALLDAKVRMGLDSPVLFKMRKNLDLSREEAIDEITENLADWAMLITMLRRLNMPTDASTQQTGNNPNDPKQQNTVDKEIGAGLGNQQPPNGANDGSATPKSNYTNH